MAVNKVVLGDSTLIDLTSDTVTEEDVVQGKIFHKANGEQVEGTLDPNAGGGGTSKDENETVNFHDYDGTLLHSFSLEEIQAMTELPPLPTQPGLICQGWNWSLEDIKDHNRALDIGATYITDDGKTRLYISVDGLLTATLSYEQSNSEGVIIDWGDGSSTTTTSLYNYLLKHTYASAGDYVITLDPVGSCQLNLGGGAKNVIGIHNGNSPTSTTYAHANMLVKVELGRNVILGRSAFYYCESLETATIPNGITRFNGAEFMQSKRLKGLVIPNGVKSINGRTLYYCCALSFVSIPNGMKSMVSDAFGNNYALKSVTFPNSMQTVNSFADYTSLKRISLPDGITACPRLAATPISSIKLPNSLTQIDGSSFDNCKALSSIEIPEAVTSIDAYAFQNCYALWKVRVPSNVTSIGNYAFDGCKGLTSVEFPNGLITIGQYAFQYCYSLTSVKIPNTVTSIGAYAFRGCTGISSIKIPSIVTSLGKYAFNKCNTLLRVELQEGLKTIGDYAFSDCVSMTSIKIPSSVTSIGTLAFGSWYNAKYYDFTSHTSVPTLTNASTFYLGEDTEIRVPAALYDEWIAATNWSSNADYIVAV